MESHTGPRGDESEHLIPTVDRVDILGALEEVASAPLIDGTQDFAEKWLIEMFHTPRTITYPSTGCLVVQQAQVTGPGRVTRSGHPVSPNTTLPPYLRDEPSVSLLLGEPHSWRRLEGRVAVATGHGTRQYGHFLLELLPRVLMLKAAFPRELITSPLLIDSRSPSWLRRLITEELEMPSEQQLLTDVQHEVVSADELLVPEYCVADLPGGYHPELKELIAEFRHARGINAKAVRPRRLFATRLLLPSEEDSVGGRTCVNELELLRIAAAEFGFTPITCETLTWREQTTAFASADTVIGPYGSALHNALFSLPGTKIGIIGPVLNGNQSQLAMALRHRMAYLSTRVQCGIDSHPAGAYYIPPDQFRAWLAAVVTG